MDIVIDPEHANAPRVPIIAVFGSGAGGPLAMTFGQEISDRGGIVLTGGSMPYADMRVKHAALRGADASAAGGPRLAPWIGVPKNTDPMPETVDVTRTYLLQLPLGDERNIVEAVLCNAAIAIAGRQGTESEVAFCLALGRPLVLVGNWNWVTPPAPAADARTRLILAITQRVEMDAGGVARPLDPELAADITDAKDRLEDVPLPPAALPMNSPPNDVLDVLDDLLEQNGQPVAHGFPAATILQPYRAPYLNWLAGVEARLAE